MLKNIKILMIAFFVFFTSAVLAANPAQPFLPSDNVQDPNCTPQDSNCYVASPASSFNENVTGLSYSTTTSTLSLTSGYVIPTVASTTQWGNLIASSSNYLMRDGNSYGTTTTIGTNDSYNLNFETNGVNRLTIDTNGNLMATGTISANALYVIDATTTRANLGLAFATNEQAVGNAIYYKTITAWGDSLTAGAGGTPYPTQLSTLYGGLRTINNKGVGGQTSTQIGVRQGGIQTNVTVAGNQIPASGPVNVTFPTGYEPATSQGGTTNGTIAGVYGTVTYTASSSVFTRSASGSIVNTSGAVPFTVDTGVLNNDVVVIWAGRNNYSNPTQVKSDIAAMVNSLGHARYVVLSVTNGEYTNEYQGGAAYNTMIQLNSDLAAAYGTHYIDVRSYLISQYNASSSQDVIDRGHDIIPSSLRSDNVHLNTAGYAIVAQLVYQKLTTMENVATSSSYVVSSANLASVFASPYAIGTTKANSGFFTVGSFTGNVGIGTTTPLALLHLASSGATTNIRLDNSGSTNAIDFFDSSSVNASPVQIARIVSGNQTNHQSGSLMFYTASNSSLVEAMRIDRSGNVGIGTSTPASKLHLQGNLTISQDGAFLKFTKSDGSSGASIGLAGDGSTMQISTGLVPYPDNTYSLGIDTQRWNNIRLGTGLSQIAGSLAIGTTTALDKLALNGALGITSTNGLLNTRAGNVGTTFNIDFPELTTAAGEARFFRNASTTGGLSVKIYNGDGSGNVQTLFGTKTGQSYINAFGGFVGIGTTSPQEKLHVDGSILLPNGSQLMSYDTTGTKTTLVRISSQNDIYVGGSSNNSVFLTNSGGIRLAATTAGNIGIGTTTPTDKLQVIGDIRVGTTSTNGCIKDYSGTGIIGTCSSDERLKTNIIDLSDGYLDKLVNLRAITYNWNDTAKEVNRVDTSVTNYGLLAQNVEQYFPELVTTDSNGYKQVNYSRLPIYLLKSIQELAKKIASFKDEFHTNKLCVGDTCVTEQQLKQLLQNQGMNASQPSAPTPTPTVEESTTTASSTVEETVPTTPTEEPASEPAPTVDAATTTE